MTGLVRAARREDGAALVEFVFVGPILFLLLLGLLDLGLLVLGRSAASSAARDGAREGIIFFDGADVPGSVNYDRIKAKVDAKLVGHIRPQSGQYVYVRCLDGATKAVKPCVAGGITIDVDLIEVEVRWQKITAGASFFVPTNNENKARMVIVGDGTSGGAPPPVDCGNDVRLAFSTAAPPPVNELDVDVSTTLTLTRTGSNLDCWSQLSYSTGGGTATANVDYEALTDIVAIFPPGVTSQAVPVVVKGDDLGEPTETFGVTLTVTSGGLAGSPATSTVSIADDDAVAPQLVSLQFFDTTTNGKVDRVVATFDQALNGTCANPGAFTFTGTPSGGTRGAVSIAGTAATVTVNEGGGPADTAGAGFQVALSAGCLTASGSGASVAFPATAAVDKARPVLLSVVDTNGATDGMAQPGDRLTFTFSEAMAPAPTPVAVVVGQGSAGQLSITGIINTTALNPKNNSNYAQVADLLFNGSTVATTGTTVVLTLGPCTTSGSCYSAPNGPRALAGQSNNAGITFAASPSLLDLAAVPNTATGSVTTGNNYRLF